MITFDDESAKRAADLTTQGGKRRAVLMEGRTDVWAIDHVSDGTLAALGEMNSDIVVAIHPITKEKLTHNDVIELVETKSFNNNLSLAEGIEQLKGLGATDHQSAMNILFPTVGV